MKTTGTFLSGAVIGASLILLVQQWRKRQAERAATKATTEGHTKEASTSSTTGKRKPVGTLLDPQYGFRCMFTKGIVYPPWSEDQEDAIDALRQRDWLQRDDIIIATYPKAGTTLMQQIVMLLLNNGDVDEVGDVMVTSPWIEREYCMAKDRPAAFESLRRKTTGGTSRPVLKTHAPYHLFPAKSVPNGCKVIVVVRDPRDVAVSMHKHYLGLPRFQYTGPFDHFINLFLAGKVGHGCFFDHVGGWWKAYQEHGPESMLWLKYEDLVSDKLGAIRQIAAFLGVPEDDDLFERVKDGSDIDNMRSNAAKKSSKGSGFGSASHFNKGVSGRWKAKLTVAQAEKFSQLYESKFRGGGEVALAEPPLLCF
jgi:hypothetical protein